MCRVGGVGGWFRCFSKCSARPSMSVSRHASQANANPGGVGGKGGGANETASQNNFLEQVVVLNIEFKPTTCS